MNIKRKVFTIIGAALVSGVILALILCGKGGANRLDKTNGAVRLTDKTSDIAESRYEVSAYLPGTDFSFIGQELKNKIAKEWETYSGMSEMQRMVSSKSWGMNHCYLNSNYLLQFQH